MPCSAAHRLGAMVAVGGGLVLANDEKQEDMTRPLAGGVIAYAFGTLPDAIEPPIHPNHRGVFHSWAAVGLLSYGLYRAYKWEPDNAGKEWCRLALIAAGGAYLVHLVMDAGTPKGLPLLV